MIILVIEAPGKKAVVEASAKKAWPNTYIQVWPTGGSLQDLTSKHIGISLDTFLPLGEKNLKNGEYFLKNLEKNKDQIDAVWCMTDPDREGEGIAHHVQQFMSKLGMKASFKRLYAYDLSPEGLKQAHQSSDTQSGLVAARSARRVLDRLIPVMAAKTTSSSNWKGKGRVQAAALNVINNFSKTIKRAEVEHVIRLKPDTPMVLKVAVDDMSQGEALKLDLLKLKKEPKVVTTIEEVEAPPPHTAASIYDTLRNLIIEHIEKGLQSGYMAGCLSYPRTDSPRYSQQQRLHVGAQAQMLAMGGKLKDHWFDEESSSGSDLFMQGAHPGLYVRQDADKSQLDDSTKTVINEVYARSMASLMIPAIIIRTRLYPTDDDNIYYESVNFKEKGWTLSYERMNLPNPLVPMPSPNLKEGVIMVRDKIPQPHDLVMELHKAGLGRPSTLSGIPRKLQESGFLSSFNELTPAGMEVLSQLKRMTPFLVDHNYTALVEKKLKTLENRPDAYAVVIQGLLSSSGMDMSVLADIRHEQYLAIERELEMEQHAGSTS